MSARLQCECGCPWWRVERQLQVGAEDYRQTAGNSEPPQIAVRVVLRCVGCGRPASPEEASDATDV